MKRNVIIICLLIIPFHLTACSSVTSKNIIGERIQDDLSEQFDGTWEEDDEIAYMKYLGKGELRIAGVEWKENKFELQELTIILTTCGDRKFVNVLDPVIEEKNDLLFAYYSFITEKTLAVWEPKVDAFEKAINEGKINGKIHKDKSSTTVSINESQESLCEFINKRDIGELFDLEDPRLYRKID
jgi:hypothetical protein